MNEAMTFNNGLTPAESDELDDLQIEIAAIIQNIEVLGKHRNYSIAITKLEEAKHWLRDRKHKPA